LLLIRKNFDFCSRSHVEEGIWHADWRCSSKAVYFDSTYKKLFFTFLILKNFLLQL